jgi:hypothetical protein
LKEKKCKVCGKGFAPFRSTQRVCSVECSVVDAKAKSWQKEKKVRKENMITASQWRKMLQSSVNAYVRARDEGRLCISCNRQLKGKYDAGHYYSVGSYPNLRYDEMNIWGQCVHCNQHLHGNLIEYRTNLLQRIGEDGLARLDSLKNEPLKLTVPEIKDLIEVYKKKIRELKK